MIDNHWILFTNYGVKIPETPPQDFSAIVASYFRKWAHQILLFYNEEMKQHKYSMYQQLLFKLLKPINETYWQHHKSLKDEKDQDDGIIV